jgi:hypothetical protein
VEAALVNLAGQVIPPQQQLLFVALAVELDRRLIWVAFKLEPVWIAQLHLIDCWLPHQCEFDLELQLKPVQGAGLLVVGPHLDIDVVADQRKPYRLCRLTVSVHYGCEQWLLFGWGC